MGIGKPDLEQWIQQKQEQQAKQRYPEGHPLAWLQAEEQVQLSEERRKEIVSLGFPDDGYDYLKHVRQGHAETAARNEQGQDHDQEGGISLHLHTVSRHFKLYLKVILCFQVDGLKHERLSTAFRKCAKTKTATEQMTLAPISSVARNSFGLAFRWGHVTWGENSSIL